MTIYDDMREVVSDVMSEFKQGKIQYCKVVPGVGPIDDPGPTTVNRFDIDGTAVGVQFKYVQNGMAVASDLQIVAPVDDRYSPEIQDQIEVDNVPYKIEQILPKPSAGKPVAYLYIIRRGS